MNAIPVSDVNPAGFRVDVVIAVHDPRRPIEQAVASARDEEGAVRITVVCHGIPATEIEERLSDYSGETLRVVEFSDGIYSPAGPFNFGISLASAPYVAVLGSDDHFETGAIRAWLDLAEANEASAIIAPVRGPDGHIIPSPLVRPGRTRSLDAARDRLAYRSAPLGLISTKLAQARAPFFTEGLASGEDIAPSMQLWFASGPIFYPFGAPAYGGGYDGEERVTHSRLEMNSELAAIDRLRTLPWLQQLNPRLRRALAIRVIRESLLDGAIARRTTPAEWSEADVSRVGTALRSWDAFSPGVLGVFPIADRDMLDVVMTEAVTLSVFRDALLAWNSEKSRWRKLLPRNPLVIFDREASVRRLIDLRRTIRRRG